MKPELDFEEVIVYAVERGDKRVIVWRDGRCLRCGVQHALTEIFFCKGCGALLCDRQVKISDGFSGASARRYRVKFVHYVYRRGEKSRYLEEVACGPCILVRFDGGREFVPRVKSDFSKVG